MKEKRKNEVKGKHLIFDFETLGTNLVRGFPPVDVSYIVFDADRFTEKPYTFTELVDEMQYIKFDVADYCKRFGYKPEAKTIDWWESQSKDARKKILPTPNDLKLEKAMDQFVDYVASKNPKFWWSRGNIFDPLIFYRLFDDLNDQARFNEICPHWGVRDIRTYIDAKFDFSIDNGFVLPEWENLFIKHNSKHDVAADILRLQKIVETENEN